MPFALPHAALVLLGTALIVTPWAVRNALTFGRPVLTTTHGGYTLLLANNPTYWREVVGGPPGVVWEGRSLAAWQRSLEASMAAEGISPDEIARDRWMRRQALENIGEHPTAFLRSVVYRLGRFWSVTPSVEGGPFVRWGVGTFYAATYALAALGFVSLLLNAWRAAGFSPRAALPPLSPWLPSLALIAAFLAVHALYWTDARMRAPLIPALALLAALGASTTLQVRSARPTTPQT